MISNTKWVQILHMKVEATVGLNTLPGFLR